MRVTLKDLFRVTARALVEPASHLRALFGGPKPPSDAETLENVKSLLAKSPTGQGLLDCADKMGLKIVSSRYLFRMHGYFAPDRNIVVVSAWNDEATLLKTLAHELRHVWQYADGIDVEPNRHPSDNILIMRAIEADADAVAALVQHELAAKKLLPRSPWWKMDDRPKVNGAFSRRDGDQLRTRAAFDAWFDQTALRGAYDRHCLSWMGANARDGHYPLRPFAKRLGPGDLDLLGRLPCGRNYLTATGGFDHHSRQYQRHIYRPLDRVQMWALIHRWDEMAAAPPPKTAPAKPKQGMWRPRPWAFGRAESGRGLMPVPA